MRGSGKHVGNAPNHKMKRSQNGRSANGASRKVRAFHEDDGGFSTLGMVIALLLTLSLVFTTARVYRIESMAADVQNVADAAVLAAEGEVASFYIISQTCDAIVLSLSLTGLVAAGLGTVALCVPGAAAFSAKLLEAASKVLESRDRFAKSAKSGLEHVQELLPYLAAVQAASVAKGNGDGRRDYCGFAILLPAEGEPVSVGALDGAQDALDKIDEKREGIQEAAREAEDAAREADACKLRAFMADCGNAPGYCMYERAGTLSQLDATRNPLYRNVESWSFSVALARAQAYYPERLANEEPLGPSVEEQVNSALRKRFYEYAVQAVSKGYVHDDPTGSFEANFPLLPRNTEQMKLTSLYTQNVYPVSTAAHGALCMHAWDGCPALASQTYVGMGSIEQMDSSFTQCETCKFNPSSMGNVAAASTSIENGFEYHYLIVANEAKAYQAERERYAPAAQAVKMPVEEIISSLGDLLKSAAGARITAYPPGRYGAVAVVADVKGVPADELSPSSFVSSDASLGASAAVSGATLADDDPSESENIISSFLDRVSDDASGFGVEGIQIVLDLWSGLLFSYAQGQESLEQGIENAIDRIPLASSSGLGKWAAGAFSDAVSAVGLQPAKLAAPKPVLVNTAHPLSHDSGPYSEKLLQVKKSYANLPGSGTGDPLSVAVDALEATAIDAVESLGDRAVVVEVSILGADGPTIPISITLPPAVTEYASGIVKSIAEELRSLVATISGVRIWQ